MEKSITEEVALSEYIPFESIKQIDDEGNEFWYARDLQVTLGYSKWQNFSQAINRAIVSCKSSGIRWSNHFTGVSKMVKKLISRPSIL